MWCRQSSFIQKTWQQNMSSLWHMNQSISTNLTLSQSKNYCDVAVYLRWLYFLSLINGSSTYCSHKDFGSPCQWWNVTSLKKRYSMSILLNSEILAISISRKSLNKPSYDTKFSRIELLLLMASISHYSLFGSISQFNLADIKYLLLWRVTNVLISNYHCQYVNHRKQAIHGKTLWSLIRLI